MKSRDLTNEARDPVKSLERLQEIYDLDLASAERDPILQEMLDAAADELDLPIALVSIVLDEAQYFAAMHGLDGWMEEARGTPVEWSFCTNVVLSGKTVLIDDATEDERTKDNPLVYEENIRSYAGVPLQTSKGEVVGSFCVIGSEPREFSEEDVAGLERLAAKAMARIEKRRKA